MDESHQQSSHKHHRHKKKNFLDSFLKQLFGSRSSTSPEAQEPAPSLPSSPPAGVPGEISSEESHRHHRRQSPKKKNPIDEFITKFLLKLADRAERNRERRRERKRRRMHKREVRRKRRRERLRNHPVRIFFKKLFQKKQRGYYDEPQQQKSELIRQRKRLAYFSINSIIIYLITFFIAYLTYQAAVMLSASRWGINSVLFYYEVFFPIGNNSEKWNSFNIIVITFMGPFISLVMGVIYMLFFVRKDQVSGLRKLFFFWLGMHSLNFFLGAFTGGMITYQGFGYVIAWMFMPTWLKFAISILLLFSLALIGFLHTRFFLASTCSLFWTKKQNRPWVILFGAFLPWLLSIIFLFIFRYPRVIPQHSNIVVYDTIIYVTMIFAIIPMVFNFRTKPEFDPEMRRSSMRKVNWIYLLVFLGLAVIFRLGLNGGFYYLPF